MICFFAVSGEGGPGGRRNNSDNNFVLVQDRVIITSVVFYPDSVCATRRRGGQGETRINNGSKRESPEEEQGTMGGLQHGSGHGHGHHTEILSLFLLPLLLVVIDSVFFVSDLIQRRPPVLISIVLKINRFSVSKAAALEQMSVRTFYS